MFDIELIVFAVVAVFVLSRLYAVLGKKTGAEPPPSVVREATERRTQQDAPQQQSPLRPAFTGPGAVGMEEIAALDTNFAPDSFLSGAKKAYEMIVTAFAEGEKDTLSQFLSEDVFEAYSAAIDAREADEKEPMRLLRLKSGEIADAELVQGDTARVSVSFEAELSDGEIQRTAKEIWTFERLAKSKDPNWRLVEVSEAS